MLWRMDVDRHRILRWVLPIGAIVVGLVAGWAIAYLLSVGGTGGILGAYGLILGLLLLILVVGVIWETRTRIRHGDVGQARRRSLKAGGLLVAGAIAGAAGGAALLPFSGRESGAAECHSVADSRIVAYVEALELGELGSGTLRSTIFVDTIDAGRLNLQLFVDLADLPEGTLEPIWAGSASVVELNADRTAGRVTFEHAVRTLQEPGASAPPSDWPAELSGTISWGCDPW